LTGTGWVDLGSDLISAVGWKLDGQGFGGVAAALGAAGGEVCGGGGGLIGGSAI